METVTQANLLDAIRRAMTKPHGPDDAWTIHELASSIADDSGSSVEYTTRKVRAAIPKLRTAGVLEMVKVQRQSVDDRNIVTAAFRFRGA